MRLTLRTLLAYLDGILPPKDHEELAQQIEGSDNAKELIHRTGDTVRRIRLGAPPVDSPTHDANDVAEYLDNTMSPEEVVEFERRCLESDPELAEVASSHHVLKMVLAERAEVDDDLRRVMYGLPAEHAKAQRATPVVERPTPAPAPASTREPAEVPDYLRASQPSLIWRLAPAIGTLALLAVAAVIFAPGGVYDQAKNAPAESTPETSGDNVAPIGKDAEQPADPASPAAENDPADEVATDGSIANAADPPTGNPSEVDPTVDPTADTSTADTPTTASSSPSSTTPSVAPALPPTEGPRTEEPSTAEQPKPTDTSVAGSDRDETADAATGESDVEPSRDAAEGAAEIEPTVDEPAVEPVEIGMVSTPGEVLLRYAATQDEWQRLAVGAGAKLPSVLTGDRLLSLPYYRPVIAIKGLNASLSGATLIKIDEAGAPDAAEPTAAIRLVYGRLVLQNTGADPATIRLTVGERSGTATINRGAVLAVEAERVFQPGLDPMVGAPPLAASYYVPQGGVVWQGGGEAQAIETGSIWREIGGQKGPIEPFSTPVEWLIAEPLSNLQRQAAAEMSQNLVGGEAIWPQLEVLKNARRIEQQALAAIASMHVGHYSPSIRSLSDGEQRSVWGQEIRALRATMSRSPELAQAVRETLVKDRGEQYAAELYRMLCGFTPEQVGLTPEAQRVGVLRQLVDWLESDQLDHRVLANHNLEEITGRRGVFNPVGLLRSREATIGRFRNRLEEGEMISRSGR